MEDKKRTICWDCGNATGGCCWSESLTPVKGWNAIRKDITGKENNEESYIVLNCPEFTRDARGYGAERMRKT